MRISNLLSLVYLKYLTNEISREIHLTKTNIQVISRKTIMRLLQSLNYQLVSAEDHERDAP